MRVGCLTYATNRGLSHLARDFHRHGLITDVCVVRHPGIPTQEDWYPGSPVVDLRNIDRDKVRAWAQELEVLLAFETFFDWDLVPWCQARRIKTVLVPMYECFRKGWLPPDKFICPSALDYQYFFGALGGWKPCELLPLPVEYPWRLRERAEHWIHNGGYLGVKTRKGNVRREGTTTLIEAMRHVKSPIQLTIRVQENVSPEYQRMCAADPRIEYIAGSVPYEELYATGDVAVGAQRWNGCSLPLQEAFAAGMLIVNTDRFPMNTWLPNEPLVPVRNVIRGSSIGGGYLEFDEADVHPEDLARTIDAWHGRDITEFSLRGKAWAEENSWAVLGPSWRKALEC